MPPHKCMPFMALGSQQKAVCKTDLIVYGYFLTVWIVLECGYIMESIFSYCNIFGQFLQIQSHTHTHTHEMYTYATHLAG